MWKQEYDNEHGAGTRGVTERPAPSCKQMMNTKGDHCLNYKKVMTITIDLLTVSRTMLIKNDCPNVRREPTDVYRENDKRPDLSLVDLMDGLSVRQRSLILHLYTYPLSTSSEKVLTRLLLCLCNQTSPVSGRTHRGCWPRLRQEGQALRCPT